MSLSKNPTRTRTIEKAWQRDINRRWREYKKSTIEWLNASNNALIKTNATKPFEFDASQIRIYMTFADAQIQRLLLGANEAPNWQAQYQIQSYQRALETTRAQLISQGAAIIPTQEEVLAGQGMRPLTATPSLASAGIITQPIHSDALQFLYTRSYDSLKNWTDRMSVETRQILVDGMEQGKGIRELTRDISKRIDVSRSRAELIARTETVQAFQRGSTAEANRLEEELGEPILMRWLSAADSRVRHLHANWHGTLATPEQNFERIGVSSFNCRCTQIATIEDAITPKKQEKFDKERKALLRMQR